MEEKKIEVSFVPNGPVVVNGKIEITLADKSVEVKEKTFLCRCGFSNNKPYCDGSHQKHDWKE